MLNSKIRATEVRLIDGDFNDVVPREEAERRAKESGNDLLIVSMDSSPIVVRLVDFGKFKYEQEKKQREAEYLEQRKRAEKELMTDKYSK